MSDEWLPGLVLPNLHLRDPIEAGIATFVPWSDKRLVEVCKKDKHFNTFLSRFTDAFGVELQPCVLLITSRLNMAMVAALRDALSMCVVPYSHARMLIYGRTMNFPFSDAFDFYPWMPNNDDEGGMTAFTPALTAFHLVKEFKGQSSPLLSIQTLDRYDIDRVLFNELLLRWARRYSTQTPSWSDVAVFRSLDMANGAAKIPAGRDVTEYSTGRSLGNWISAFEVLLHPEGGTVDYKKVYHHFDEVQWQDDKLKKNEHDAYPGKEGSQKRSLACWIYGELLRARNNYLHGDALKDDRLRLESGRYLHHYAAPLYRMALTGFLALNFTEEMPELNNPKAFGRHIAKSMDFLDRQNDMERALLTVHKPPKR